MDPDAISRQARAAIDSLTMQLQALEAQQSALLSSVHLTLTSLSPPSPDSPTTSIPTTAIPNYHLISPTLSLIPIYTAKLTRLRTIMSSQTLEITQLRRRVEEVKRQRRRNSERTRERWEKERERDRTVLRAKMAVESPGFRGKGWDVDGGATSAVSTPGLEIPRAVMAGVEGGSGGGGLETSDGDIASLSTISNTPVSSPPLALSPLGPGFLGQQEGSIRIVKRKKKVRQAEMQ